MEKHENKIIKILIIVLVLIGLSGCGVKTINTTQDNTPTLIDSVGKMESIGIVLGCMFAPHTCSEVKVIENICNLCGCESHCKGSCTECLDCPDCNCKECFKPYGE